MISNVDAAPHSDPEVIKAILAKQVGGVWCAVRCSNDPRVSCVRSFKFFSLKSRPALPVPQLTAPVQWETTLKTLLDKGLERSYEIGPNKVRAAACPLELGSVCTMLLLHARWHCTVEGR